MLETESETERGRGNHSSIRWQRVNIRRLILSQIVTDWPQNESAKSSLNIGRSVPLEAPLWGSGWSVPMQQALLFSGGTKGRPWVGMRSSLVTKSVGPWTSISSIAWELIETADLQPHSKATEPASGPQQDPSNGPYTLWNLRGPALGPSSLNQNVPGFLLRESHPLETSPCPPQW